MESADQRLDVKEAADLLGVSPFTLRKRLRDKVIPYYKVGRRIVLDRCDLEAYFARCRKEALHQ